MIPEGVAVTTPTGYAEFPFEMLRPPRSLSEKMFVNVRRWSVMKRGGHFATVEQPEDLAKEIRAFFRPLRKGTSCFGCYPSKSFIRIAKSSSILDSWALKSKPVILSILSSR